MFARSASLIETTDPAGVIELDWRFAELVADTWVEPGLALRYSADPVTVLAEYGIAAGAAQDVPRLPATPDVELLIEDFSGDDAEFPAVPMCLICSMDMPAVPGAVTAG